MNVLLCCNTDSILDRWEKALQPEYNVFPATALEDLELYHKKTSFDILLIHTLTADAAAVAELVQQSPTGKFFLLSNRPDNNEGLQYLRAGAVGYANSYINPMRLNEAVKTLLAGSVWVNQNLMQLLITGMQPQTSKKQANEKTPTVPPAFQNLSDREYQIASLVAEGLSNPAIAEQLSITERTVKAHLSAVYTKTNTKGRLNLALLFNKT